MSVDISHFTMVGLAVDVSGEEAMSRSVQPYLAGCASRELAPAAFVCVVKLSSGSELRFGMRRGPEGVMQIATMNPAFAGEGRADVDVVGDDSDPNEKPFEVTISARFRGEATPLVFDLADPSETAAKPGTRLTVDLAAFSYHPELFEDEAAFARSQADHKLKYAPNFFIPSGMFFGKVGGAMPDDAKRPIAYADFAGTVLKAELRSNAGGKFWWALVKTYTGQTIDVVMDPRTIAQEPKPGWIVSGRFWLSAHVVPTP